MHFLKNRHNFKLDGDTRAKFRLFLGDVGNRCYREYYVTTKLQ